MRTGECPIGYFEYPHCPLLEENAEYLGPSHSPPRRQERWRAFLVGVDPREQVVRRGDWAIGDPGFRRWVLLEQGRAAPVRHGRPPKQGGATGCIQSYRSSKKELE